MLLKKSNKWQSLALLLTLIGGTSSIASAATRSYNFSFFGSEPNQDNPVFNQQINGSGNFSFNSNSTIIGLSDLTGFSASGYFDPGHGPGFSTWDFVLSDLSSFSFDLSNPASFSLQTASIIGSGGYPGALNIESSQVTLGQGSGAITSITATPEPASFALIAIAGLALLPYLKRRQKPGGKLIHS